MFGAGADCMGVSVSTRNLILMDGGALLAMKYERVQMGGWYCVRGVELLSFGLGRGIVCAALTREIWVECDS